MRRLVVMVAAFFVLALALLAFAACGSPPPSAGDIQKNAKFFYLTRPDGKRMQCLEFYQQVDSSDGKPHLAFAIDCDWSGQATAG